MSGEIMKPLDTNDGSPSHADDTQQTTVPAAEDVTPAAEGPASAPGATPAPPTVDTPAESADVPTPVAEPEAEGAVAPTPEVEPVVGASGDEPLLPEAGHSEDQASEPPVGQDASVVPVPEAVADAVPAADASSAADAVPAADASSAADAALAADAASVADVRSEEPTPRPTLPPSFPPGRAPGGAAGGQRQDAAEAAAGEPGELPGPASAPDDVPRTVTPPATEPAPEPASAQAADLASVPVTEDEPAPRGPGAEPSRVERPPAGVSASQGPEAETSDDASETTDTAAPAPETQVTATPEEPVSAGEEAEKRSSDSQRRRRRRILAGAAGALVVLAWGAAAWATTQTTFSGASVSGVDVSGMSTTEARDVVEQSFAAGLTEPVTVTAIGASDELVPAESGVSIDAVASVQKLTGFTLNPIAIVQRLTGPEVEAVVDVDREALASALYARLSTLSTGTVDATVTLDGTTPVVTAAVSGTGLDVARSVDMLAADWPLGDKSIALAEGVAEPAITDADAEALVEGTLTPLLSGDLTITATGTSVEATASIKDLVLTPEQVAGLITVAAEGGDLVARLDAQGLHDQVVAAMGPIEIPATDATWTIDGSAAGAASATPQFVPSATGSSIDSDALVAALVEAGRTGTSAAERTVTIPIKTVEPTVTTPEEEWGIVEVIGEYSTPFTSQAGRDQNLIRGAELMNGQIVMPGETFSVTEALGTVDAANGFTYAGVVNNGEHTEAMGGGLSQIGTTMFNAGFESGMDDVEHHPHSYWFSRYPAGREATIWTGHKDVKFANSTPYPALIQAWVADGEVHARLWSTHYYDVTITSSERYNYRPVQTITRTAGPGCTPYGGGNAGFDITVTRTRKAPDKTVPDDVLVTSYEADHNIRCVTPEPAPTTASAAPAEPSGSSESAAATEGE